MLEFCYVGDYNRNVNSDMGGNNLEFKLGLLFYHTFTQILSKYQRWKEGQCTYSNQLTNLETLFCDFLGSIAIWGNNATTLHLPHGFTPTNTCPTKSSNGRCLRYCVFECHANFQINWESLAHRDQQRTCFRYVAPKPWRWQMSSMHPWTSSIVN